MSNSLWEYECRALITMPAHLSTCFSEKDFYAGSLAHEVITCYPYGLPQSKILMLMYRVFIKWTILRLWRKCSLKGTWALISEQEMNVMKLYSTLLLLIWVGIHRKSFGSRILGSSRGTSLLLNLSKSQRWTMMTKKKPVIYKRDQHSFDAPVFVIWIQRESPCHEN